MFDQIVNGIHVRESEDPPDLIDMTAVPGFFFSSSFTQTFRVRRKVCEKIAAARKHLPPDCHFLV